MKKIQQDLKDGVRYTNAIQRLDKFIKTNPGYDWKKSLVKEGLQFTSKVSSDLDKYRKGQLEMSQNNYSGISGNNTTASGDNKTATAQSLQAKMQAIKDKQNEMNNSMSKTDAFKNKMAQAKRQSIGGVNNHGLQGLQNAG